MVIVWYHQLLLVLLIFIGAAKGAQYIGSGASQPNRTDVVWMVPSWTCKNEYSIDVEKYGILQNEDQHFVGGKQFAIFYEHSFGKIPYFKAQNESDPKNGGLPQMGDLEAHLIQAEKDINETIPDENFNGIAVIDIEEFRPMWELSWGPFSVYKTESIRLTRQQHPYWSTKQIEWQAERDYEKACQKFFIETLRLGKRLRPNAKWGYYLFPKCNGDVGQKSDTDCSTLFQKFNDNLHWLWGESTALFPSIYLYPSQKQNPEYNFVNSGALITETKRIKRNYCPSCEIHVFTKIEYNPYYTPDDFYSKQNLASTLDLAIKMNANSVVIWSTSQSIGSRCGSLQTYVDNTLGPYLQLTDRNLDKCRMERCEGRGECYLPRPKTNPAIYNFACRCERPYFGKSCEYRGRRMGVSMPKASQTPQVIPDVTAYFSTSSNGTKKYNAPNQFYSRTGGDIKLARKL
ncbi:Chondroitin hydrolase [Caenorhabditis elegans]|uniref:Chondroitin hydrolase n=1 Tax=Caenorhabditis elegans TaxID=6239 RepID=CHHY1_CAEEL|nr:Hyaluronidase [Caenorhabditis elegans]BAG48551.1 chondroitin hydrolase [Caenorhabditis elegans]CAA88874.1 Hyaluronidase [Caenorhabditis elegans]|eukprot:NP_495830.1 Hyaluronidase [Caenorhabditis elegans]